MTDRRRWAAFILAPLLVLVSWPAALAVQIYRYSLETCSLPAGAAVVLGAAVWNDRPSPVFEERIRHGLELYHTGRVQTLVMTGGRSDGDLLAEAEVARSYVLARGGRSSQSKRPAVSPAFVSCRQGLAKCSSAVPRPSMVTCRARSEPSGRTV